MNALFNALPSPMRETLFLRFWSFFKVRTLNFVQPSVEDLNDDEMIVSIPLNWRTRNHLNCMYFGVLAAGADCAGGFLALHILRKHKTKASIIFKDFQANFLKRAEGKTYFKCRDGQKIRDGIVSMEETGERLNMPVEIIATVPDKTGDEPVATFTLTLSMKPSKKFGT
jgi:acyl-coenzyme A thioesterase PaaI-like protein